MKKAPEYKVVMLGESWVGKTSLSIRFAQDQFEKYPDATMQASFVSKQIWVMNTNVNLHVWDTAGQERYARMASIYYKESSGAIIVYDITDLQSFERMQEWVKELMQNVEQIQMIIVGNKIDLEHKRAITLSHAQEYSREVGAFHVQTSAKTGDQVNTVFEELAKKMLQVPQRPSYLNSRISIVDRDEISPKVDNQRK